ncbi:unnamed protein product, partial [Adineta ricciae]
MSAATTTDKLGEKNLENFSLVWLDETASKHPDEEKRLRTVISHLKKFDGIDQTESYIQSVSKEDQIVFVVNGKCSHEIISRIHLLPQIFAIYIYDSEITDCMAEFNKVKGVNKELKLLVEQIIANHCDRINGNLSLNVFNASTRNQEQSTSSLNGQFIHCHLLIDCLLNMIPKSTDKDQLIDLCRKYYKDNPTELAIVNEFQRNYVADRALWWYTRESFLYRLLNKALRTQDIDFLFLFRFFIRDLENQLKQLQSPTKLRVYRGQVISNDELEALKTSIGQFISMNSFLSTSVDRRSAVSFLYSSTASADLQRILFEIDLDPSLAGIKPFANITSHSFFTDEQEVLVMLGSIFRLVNLEYKDRAWVAQLSLCSDEDNDTKAVYDYIRNEYGEGEQGSSLFSFGVLLFKMGQYEKAEQYYHRLLNELPNDHEDLPSCYHNLGMMENHRGNYTESLQWLNKALQMYTQTLKSDDPIIARTYNSIGEVQLRTGDKSSALESFTKALNIRKKAFGEDHLLVAMCYHNIG